MIESFERARRRGARAGAAALLLGLSCGAAAAAGDAARGEVLYEGCQDCHSLDKNDVGPRHRGVFGRKAGSLPDYEYSDALKQSGIVWDVANLDRWLTDPQGFIPGVKMFYHLDDEKDRADVIAFLAERAR
jgi:cytochrome c